MTLTKHQMAPGTTERLLEAIWRAQSQFIQSAPTPMIFEALLETLLSLTASDYGFIGAIHHDPDGTPYLKTHAISNIAWNREMREFFDKHAPEGLEFRNLDTLFGAAITTGDPVIANEPRSDPRAGGTPEGHPELKAFLGLPFHHGDELVGVVGIANRPNGYDAALIEFLQPFVATCAVLITAQQSATRQKKTEEALRESEERMRHALHGAQLGLWDWHVREERTVFSDGWATMLGYEPDEIAPSRDTWENLLHPDDKPDALAALTAHLEGAAPTFEAEFRLRCKSGEWKWISSHGSVRERDEKGPMRMSGIHIDISERREAEARRIELETQLRQAQKMEAVGQLAGGIAHDFNNLLTVINGFAEVLLVKLDEESSLRRDVSEILRAGEKAASLTRPLLAFSRKQVFEPVVIDAGELVRRSTSLLGRLLGPEIEIVLDFASEPCRVRVDPVLIEQVLLNVSVNARDAMPGGGTLTISTRRLTAVAALEARKDMAPMPYVMLSLEDTGEGMTPDIMEHVFEPFFTTKDPNAGSGLGLSMAYGIIQQSDGYVSVESEPGKGTRFDVFLPWTDEPLSVERELERTAASGRAGRILLVDDDEMVRGLTRAFLEGAGFRVVEARGAQEALGLEDVPEGIDALVTDLVMPKVNGLELARLMRERRPELKVLVTSGYPDKIHEAEPSARDVAFLSKPFTRDAFLASVRQLLV